MMDEERIARSLYVADSLWKAFALACIDNNTNRTRQIEKMMQDYVDQSKKEEEETQEPEETEAPNLFGDKPIFYNKDE